MPDERETWIEWAKRVGVNLNELCVCGHKRIEHNGNKRLGGCLHSEWRYRSDPVSCFCHRFRKKIKIMEGG